MKRLFSVLLSAALLFALTACSTSGRQTQNTPPAQEPENTPAVQQRDPKEETNPETAPEPASGDGGVLVIYYSATGNTEAVAGYIADALDGDLFEIVPAEAYSSEDLDWTNDHSRVSREHADPALRTMELVSSTVDNWADYDTVLIGYPIWWGSAAWPVDNFVTANDFTGKTVIPFCTSSSSGLGESGELLAGLAGTGEWLEGRRFRSSVAEADVVEWVNGLAIN